MELEPVKPGGSGCPDGDPYRNRPGRHPDGYPGRDRHPHDDPRSNGLDDPFADDDADGYGDPVVNVYRYRDGNRHLDRYIDRHRHSIVHGHPDLDIYRNTHGDPDVDRHGHPDRHSDGYVDLYANCDFHGYDDVHAVEDADGVPNGDCNGD